MSWSRAPLHRSAALAATLVVLAQLLAAGPIAAQSGSSATGDPVGTVGHGVLEAADAGPVVVAIALRADGTGIDAAQDQALAVISPDNLGAVHRFENVPALVVEIDGAANIERLAESPVVERIDLDVGGRALLDDVVPIIGADALQRAGVDGTGVTVAVIDSGVQSDHPDLTTSVADHQACFGFDGSPSGIGFCPDGSDLQIGSRFDVPPPAREIQGHGTHVAGIIASDGVVSPVGVAPGATIVALKALDDRGVFISFQLNIVAALDYIIANPQLGVDVVNLSLGTFAEFPGVCDRETAYAFAGFQAVEQLRAQGVTVIAASGDSTRSSMPAPACLSNVISVAASDDRDRISPDANTNAFTDLVAPGIEVLSSEIGSAVGNRGGSSMAAGVASGCAALLIQDGQGASPDALAARLRTSSVTLIDTKNGLAFPRLECAQPAARLLTIAKALVGPAPAQDWQIELTADAGCFVDDPSASDVIVSIAAAGGTSAPIPIRPGCSVTASEVPVPGYLAEPATPQTVEMTDDRTIELTNTKQVEPATITIDKVVDGDDTLLSRFTITTLPTCSADPTSVTITGTGTATVDVTDVTSDTAEPCRFVIDESPIAGYTVSPAAQQIVEAGRTVTFTNTSVLGPTPTPSPSPTATATPRATPAPTPTPAPTALPGPTPAPTALPGPGPIENPPPDRSSAFGFGDDVPPDAGSALALAPPTPVAATAPVAVELASAPSTSLAVSGRTSGVTLSWALITFGAGSALLGFSHVVDEHRRNRRRNGW